MADLYCTDTSLSRSPPANPYHTGGLHSDIQVIVPTGQSWPTCIVWTLPFPGHPRPIRIIPAAFTPISKSTSLQDNPGQPAWYRYNSRSGLSVPHEYNNISAGLGWPVWIGFLSTWVVRMVRVNSIERCVYTALKQPSINHHLLNDSG